ncbi:MAG: hypothetical protein ACKODM_13180, partial [Cytophagales bacterium]
MKTLPLVTLIALAACSTTETSDNTTQYDFKKESGINDLKISAKLVDDLFVLCKVWGFLKYHHPVVAVGSINWDEALFKIIPKVIDSKSKNSRNKILGEWVGKLGAATNKRDNEKSERLIKVYPDSSWVYDTELLGRNLSNKLVNIKNSFASDTNRYVQLRYTTHPIFTGGPYW